MQSWQKCTPVPHYFLPPPLTCIIGRIIFTVTRNITMDIRMKRIYEPPSKKDGFRMLVDRLWPRGISKEKARIDLWLKEVAPSNELRKWSGHKEERWREFKKRYFGELKNKKELLDIIIEKSRKSGVTLLYAAKNEKHNNAVALKEYIENMVIEK
jgi:uncharacterized protein YeaO (DUF488 family)